MKHVWCFLIGAFGSHFHSHLTERSIWESHATFSHIGSVRPLTQLCGSSFLRALILAVEHLYSLETGFSQPRWQDDIESSRWLELLHPFTAVKDLYISSKFTPRIASALKEALPSLQNPFWRIQPHREVSRKPSGSLFLSLLLRDSLPVTWPVTTPLPFPTGKESR